MSMVPLVSGLRIPWRKPQSSIPLFKIQIIYQTFRYIDLFIVLLTYIEDGFTEVGRWGLSPYVSCLWIGELICLHILPKPWCCWSLDANSTLVPTTYSPYSLLLPVATPAGACKVGNWGSIQTYTTQVL